MKNLFRLSLFNFFKVDIKPDAFYPSIYDIDYALLLRTGKKNLFFDIEQTLLSRHELWNIPLKLKLHLRKLKEQGFEITLITNSQRNKLMAEIMRKLELPIICFCCKPLPWFLKTAVDEKQSTQCVIIGDQLFSDILLAKFLKTSSIWITPLQSSKDWYDYFLRPLEEEALALCTASNPRL